MLSFLTAPKQQQLQYESILCGQSQSQAQPPLLSSNCQSDTFTHFPPTTTSAASSTKLQQEFFILLFNLEVWLLIILIFFFFLMWILSASVDSFCSSLFELVSPLEMVVDSAAGMRLPILSSLSAVMVVSSISVTLVCSNIVSPSSVIPASMFSCTKLVSVW